MRPPVSLGTMPEPQQLDSSQALPDEELSLELIIEEEQEIGYILDELRGTKRDYSRWHRYVRRHGTTPKARLCELVGWNAHNPRLRSQEAYRIVISSVWDLLP